MLGPFLPGSLRREHFCPALPQRLAPESYFFPTLVRGRNFRPGSTTIETSYFFGVCRSLETTFRFALPDKGVRLLPRTVYSPRAQWIAWPPAQFLFPPP